MAYDQMSDKRLQWRRKIRQLCKFLLQHFQFNDHMPQQLPARCVGERAVVGKFVNLSDIVKKCAGEQEIAIDLRIVATNQVTGTKQGNNVIEQPTDVGMVQRFGSRSTLVGGGDFRVAHKGLHQRLKMMILEGCDKLLERAP